MLNCTVCHNHDDALEQCVSCGLKFCSTCVTHGILGRFCKPCGEHIKEKIYGNQQFVFSLPEPIMAKRENLLLKFDEIDMKEITPLQISFPENHLENYKREKLHIDVPKTIRESQHLHMSFPELQMQPHSEELHMAFPEITLKAEPTTLLLTFPENYLKKDILMELALKS